MKRKLSIAILVFRMCLLAALPAMAADVFRFAEEAVQVYAGYSITPELIRDGRFAEGTVSSRLSRARIKLKEELKGDVNC